jgi:serine/threonine protein kinase/tetratricopeptide (TPR) repeat protein
MRDRAPTVRFSRSFERDRTNPTTGNSGRDIEVFTEAVQLPFEDRGAFLDRACAEDEALRHKIEALLKSNDRAGAFLEEPAAGEISEGRAKAVAGEKPGDRVGRYKLLQQIGEGGCGVVFVAEQEEPVRRRVALKVVKPGMDTKSVIARFEAERQALALMDHPNIAHVFDAGATGAGRPYFVMELVRGIRITDYCDHKCLATGERLELFRKVCEAVQHAHQKGIIHRDIKPSNILVATDADGMALPKVIDFGIAKATTNQRLTDKTLFTAVEMLIGTPAYMSPEQAALTSEDVDTRTDIYSLGVLLYELLTGTTPFDSRELLKSGLDEIRRVISNEEPMRPSTRLKTILAADPASVSAQQRADPCTRINDVRGDLDWIVMKALEKDRARRYPTAHGLALDVQRYLAGEPVSARPPSRIYKLRKLIRRNKFLFAGVSLIAAVFIASLIIVSVALAKERQAHREAQVAQQKAEAGERRAQDEAATSQLVTGFLKEMLQSVDPAVARGQDAAMLRAILDHTAERLGIEMANQPEVEADLRGLLGRVYLEIGDFDQAEAMQRAALAINQKVHGPDSPQVAASLNDLGVALVRHGKWSGAGALLEQALAIRRQYFASDNAELADSLGNVAEFYTQQGRIAEAEALSREALEIRTRLFTSESLQVANSLRNLGIILGDKGRWDQAEATERKVLEIRRKLLKADDPRLATSLTDVAWAAGGTGNLTEAESLEREALAIRRKILRPDHPDIAKALYLVGDRLRQQHKLAEAYPFLNGALAMQRKLVAEDNPNLLDTLHSLAETLEEDGKFEEAEKMHREALALWRKRGESDYPQALSELGSLAHVLMSQKKLEDAEQVLDEAFSPELSREPLSADLLTLKAGIEARRGEWQKASADAIRAFENQPLSSGRYSAVAAILAKTHYLSAYDKFCKRILATFGDTTNIFIADQVAKACLLVPSSAVDLSSIGRLADTAVTLGAGNQGAMPFFDVCKALSEYRLGHFSEAAQWARRSVDSRRREAQGHAYGVLAMADWQLGKQNEARAMLANGEALAPPVMPVHAVEGAGDDWLAWLFARIQLDEATLLMNPAAAAESNSAVPQREL